MKILISDRKDDSYDLNLYSMFKEGGVEIERDCIYNRVTLKNLCSKIKPNILYLEGREVEVHIDFQEQVETLKYRFLLTKIIPHYSTYKSQGIYFIDLQGTRFEEIVEDKGKVQVDRKIKLQLEMLFEFDTTIIEGKSYIVFRSSDIGINTLRFLEKEYGDDLIFIETVEDEDTYIIREYIIENLIIEE